MSMQNMSHAGIFKTVQMLFRLTGLTINTDTAIFVGIMFGSIGVNVTSVIIVIRHYYPEYSGVPGGNISKSARNRTAIHFNYRRSSQMSNKCRGCNFYKRNKVIEDSVTSNREIGNCFKKGKAIPFTVYGSSKMCQDFNKKSILIKYESTWWEKFMKWLKGLLTWKSEKAA